MAENSLEDRPNLLPNHPNHTQTAIEMIKFKMICFLGLDPVDSQMALLWKPENTRFSTINFSHLKVRH